MLRKLTNSLLWICLMLAATAGLLSSQAMVRQQPMAQISQDRADSHKPRPMSDQIIYGFLFRKIKYLLDKEIPDHALATLLKNEYEIEPQHVGYIKQLALHCLSEVQAQDEMAKEIIKETKSRFRQGVVPSGEKVPAAPSSLSTLEEGRKLIILHARSNLYYAMGKIDFEKMDNKVKSSIGANK